VATKNRNRLRHSEPLNLELDRSILLDELSAESGIDKIVLLREAVDDLLIKFNKLQARTRKPPRRAAPKDINMHTWEHKGRTSKREKRKAI
jgi:hypothetical protein